MRTIRDDICTKTGCEQPRAFGKNGRLLSQCAEHSRSPHAHYPTVPVELSMGERWAALGVCADAALARMRKDPATGVDSIERMSRVLRTLNEAAAAHETEWEPLDDIPIGYAASRQTDGNASDLW